MARRTRTGNQLDIALLSKADIRIDSLLTPSRLPKSLGLLGFAAWAREDSNALVVVMLLLSMPVISNKERVFQRPLRKEALSSKGLALFRDKQHQQHSIKQEPQDQKQKPHRVDLE